MSDIETKKAKKAKKHKAEELIILEKAEPKANKKGKKEQDHALTVKSDEKNEVKEVKDKKKEKKKSNEGANTVIASHRKEETSEEEQKEKKKKKKKTGKKEKVADWAIGDDGDGDDLTEIKINTKFAEAFEEEQVKLAMSQKQNRQHQRSELTLALQEQERQERKEKRKREFNEEDDDDDSEDSEEDSETEDEDGELLTGKVDVDIHKTLMMIRNRDPLIYDPSKRFFDKKEENEGESSDDDAYTANKTKKNKKSKKVTIGMVGAMQVLDAEKPEDLVESEDEDAAGSRRRLGEASRAKSLLKNDAEQRDLRQAFLSAAVQKKDKKKSKDSDDDDDDDDDDDTGAGFMKLRAKSKQQVKEEEEEMEDLMKYLPPPTKGNEGEEFLHSFVAKQWWKAKDSGEIPTYKEVVGDLSDDSDDNAHEDKVDEFESEYNFRFQDEDGAVIKTHARVTDGSVRVKESKRAQERENKAKRKAEEKVRQDEQLKRMKNVKKAAIIQRLAEIEKNAKFSQKGGAEGAKGLCEEDLEEEWDPDAYDKKMEALFSEDYYDDPNYDAEADEGVSAILEEEEQSKKELFVRKYNADMDKIKKPELKKELEELYALDYEDVISGDTYCRFKYAEVPKYDYGITVEEILNSTDKELNQKVSLKKMAAYRTDKDATTPWFKQNHSVPGVQHFNRDNHKKGKYQKGKSSEPVRRNDAKEKEKKSGSKKL